MKGSSAKEIWEAALGELQVQVTRANYETWLKDTVGLSFQGEVFVIGATTTFATEWLEKRLKSLIRKTIIGITGRPLEVQFQVYPTEAAPGAVPKAAPSRGETPPSPWGDDGRGLLAKLNPQYTFATFIVGSSNRLAHAAALGAAERPGRGYNPLFIYGGVGLGKTHLLHAVGHKALEGGSLALYVSSEQFTNEFINAIKERKTEEFRQKYRTLDLLLIDDIQFIADKEQTQEEFFHTFNDLHSASRQIVITSDRPPRSMPLLEDRLRSRFAGGLIADIQPPDLETRLAILRTKAEQQQAMVPPEVLDLIARKFQNNIRELEGSLNRVVAFARLTRAAINVAMATQALADIDADTGPRRTITPALIIKLVADHFNLPPDALRGKKRDKETALARQVAMYLIREETQRPFNEIGQEMGGRDHSTVLYGYNKIASEINVSTQLRRSVLQIRDSLYSQRP